MIESYILYIDILFKDNLAIIFMINAEQEKDLKRMSESALIAQIGMCETAIENPNQGDYGLASLFLSRDAALDELANRTGIARDKVYFYYKSLKESTGKK